MIRARPVRSLLAYSSRPSAGMSHQRNHSSSSSLGPDSKSSSTPRHGTSIPLASGSHHDSKGKGKADNGHYHNPWDPEPSVMAAIDEALSTPLPQPSTSSSLGSSFDRPSPISSPPRAHHAPSLRPAPQRLLSNLARSTLPNASFAYANKDTIKRRSVSSSDPYTQQQLEDSSQSRRLRTSPTTAINDEPFPDLDPTTGLPFDQSRRNSADSSAPSLHLQRTITDLLQSPVQREPPSYLPFNLSIPRVGLPNLSTSRSSSETRRSISSSAPQEDWSSWASGWWSGNKKSVDKTLSEEDQADTVEEEREKHRRKYRTPKNPMVFCHGLLGFDYLGPASLPPLQISHWRGITDVLQSNGVDLLIAKVPATSSIKDRAAILAEAIAEKYAGQEVNLIGHSMGGLDCRYLISALQPTKFKIISLTTVSTPHRGSPFADYVIDNFIGRERLPSLLSLMETLRLPSSGDGTAFEALGTRAMKEFNSLVVDDPNVSYFSWGANYDPGLLDPFRWSHSVILAKEGPNDGLVSVHSAVWGDYRGTLVGVSHPDLVGWVNQVRYAVAGWTGKPIAFKPATFYLEVADYLAEQGF